MSERDRPAGTAKADAIAAIERVLRKQFGNPSWPNEEYPTLDDLDVKILTSKIMRALGEVEISICPPSGESPCRKLKELL